MGCIIGRKIQDERVADAALTSPRRGSVTNAIRKLSRTSFSGSGGVTPGEQKGSGE